MDGPIATLIKRLIDTKSHLQSSHGISGALIGTVTATLAITACCTSSSQQNPQNAPPGPPSTIELNGEQMQVRWSDGDSFKFTSGPYKKSGVRLLGFNTLESYGPVHSWGTWTPQELYAIARTSKSIGAARGWRCQGHGERDGYGRLLLRCEDAAREFVKQGHAHVMTLDDGVPEGLLELQRQAQAAGRGIWAKGVPANIVTSVHSADEERGGYNRIVSATTGRSTVRKHESVFDTCQNVCEGAQEGTAGSKSCMIYVPYEHRYRNKPDCLRQRPYR